MEHQPGPEYTLRSRFDAHVDTDATCILRAPAETDNIHSLFSSSQFLRTELPDFTLPQACQEAFQKAKQSTETRFDRSAFTLMGPRIRLTSIGNLH